MVNSDPDLLYTLACAYSHHNEYGKAEELICKVEQLIKENESHNSSHQRELIHLDKFLLHQKQTKEANSSSLTKFVVLCSKLRNSDYFQGQLIVT